MLNALIEAINSSLNVNTQAIILYKEYKILNIKLYSY
jgi:hypothetical protein